jgi:hypothetical protein
VLKSAHGRDFTFEKLLKDEVNILAVIGEDAHNYHPKKVVALDYDISKIYYSEIYLLDSNYIYIILDFQLGCIKNFKILHLMDVSNPTIIMSIILDYLNIS